MQDTIINDQAPWFSWGKHLKAYNQAKNGLFPSFWMLQLSWNINKLEDCIVNTDLSTVPRKLVFMAVMVQVSDHIQPSNKYLQTPAATHKFPTTTHTPPIQIIISQNMSLKLKTRSSYQVWDSVEL